MKVLLNAARISEIVESIPAHVEKKCGWTNCKVTIEGKHGTDMLSVDCSNADGSQYYNLSVDLRTGRAAGGRTAALFLTEQVDELMGLV